VIATAQPTQFCLRIPYDALLVEVETSGSLLLADLHLPFLRNTNRVPNCLLADSFQNGELNKFLELVCARSVEHGPWLDRRMSCTSTRV